MAIRICQSNQIALGSCQPSLKFFFLFRSLDEGYCGENGINKENKENVNVTNDGLSDYLLKVRQFGCFLNHTDVMGMENENDSYDY